MKKIRVSFFAVLIIFMFSTKVLAATPLIKDAVPPDCYYHYDGKIWVCGYSMYNAEIKKAIKAINKQFNVFRWTTDKDKSDVCITDKAKGKGTLGLTYTDKSRIYLYKKSMKRLTKNKRILVIEHELCHAAGIDHSKKRNSLMYGNINYTKGLTKEDLSALKKARKRALKEAKQRKRLYQGFLSCERAGETILISSSQGSSEVLAFPKRGTRYHSSDKNVLSVQFNGVLTVKKKGSAILTVMNAGKKHKFYIQTE